MSALKDILSRQEERFNLKNADICVLAVLVLVTIAFSISEMKFLFQKELDDRPAPITAETQRSF